MIVVASTHPPTQVVYEAYWYAHAQKLEVKILCMNALSAKNTWELVEVLSTWTRHLFMGFL